MSALVRYDAMCVAIAECHRVDEVKDLRDKAMALEAYARMAQNAEAERKACEVRLRAERRCGELLTDMKRIPAAEKAARANTSMGYDVPATIAGTSPSPYRAALESAGITERTAQRYQELSNVPKGAFEDALRSPTKPTTSGILRAANGATKMDDGSLWVWGRIRDFERDGYFTRSAEDVFGGMTDTMQADVRRILPTLIDWLQSFEEVTA